MMSIPSMRDTLNESAPRVLANDGDQNGDAFTAVKDSDPSSGTLDFYADGSFDYTPSGCPSQDSFTYHTTDTMEDSPIATVTIDMIPAADLILTKTDASDPACVGVPFDYGITVFNNGPCEATAVTLSDTLPTGFGSISAVPSQGSCGVNGQLVTCDLGTVAASAGATVTITSTPSSAGSVDNTASVAATEDDPYASNNSDTESTQVLSGPPAAPSAPSVTDNDPCAQDGVSVTWTGVSGADGYDLQVDGLTIVSDVMSPHTYDPGDTDPHDYQVRAWNGCGSSGWSSATQGTDAHASDPGAPAIVVITDDDACGTGVTITFTPGSGATSHDLWVDGAEAATGISSPCGYDPGIPGFNGYVIRANNALCHTDSPVSSFEDADNSPMPSIMGDMGNLCPDETVSLATETGMSNYQWYLDGSPISGATSDNYTATQSGEYTVSYTEGSGCSGTSAMHWVDIFSCGGSGIYPAPDGSGGTTPLTGLWMGADMIHVEWDATTCPAMDYNIIYGSLDNVFSYTLIGGECNLGALGSYDWMAPTGTDLYFLVVGTDGTGIESSWGTDSLGAERNGTNHSGTCMAWDKDTTETCP